jgi:anti-sigma B factor antagonist
VTPEKSPPPWNFMVVSCEQLNADAREPKNTIENVVGGKIIVEMLVTVSGRRVLVSLLGEMYVEDAAKFREETMKHLESGHINFEIDMAKMDYIDSSGLGVLVALQKRAIQKQGKVVIRGLNGNVKDLFELTRLIRVFEIES